MVMEWVALAVIIGLIVYFRKRKKAKEVAEGLQCFDPNGNPLFDSSINTTRVIGTFDTGTNDGAKVVTGFEGKKLWATINYISTPANVGYWEITDVPIVTISGNTITWRYEPFDVDILYSYWYLDTSFKRLSVNVIYGVYE